MPKDKKLHPTEDEISFHKQRITPVIKARSKKDDVSNEVDSVIEDCINGWPNAPKSFANRITRRAKLYGIDGENTNNLKKPANKKKDIDGFLSRRSKKLEKFMALYDPFVKKLTKVQQDHFFERLSFYLNEFDFNLSSDLTLLLQLIVSEISVSDKQVKMLKEKDIKVQAAMSKFIMSINEEMLNLQKVLGITREQRQKGMGHAEGSISALAASVDEKIKNVGKIEAKEKEQEDLLMEAKMRRDDLNPIPDDPTELAEILKSEEEIRVE